MNCLTQNWLNKWVQTSNPCSSWAISDVYLIDIFTPLTLNIYLLSNLCLNFRGVMIWSIKQWLVYPNVHPLLITHPLVVRHFTDKWRLCHSTMSRCSIIGFIGSKVGIFNFVHEHNSLYHTLLGWFFLHLSHGQQKQTALDTKKPWTTGYLMGILIMVYDICKNGNIHQGWT